MDLGLADKVALITGSSRGLGRAIAAALHREGCFVVLNGRDRETLAEVAQSLGDNVHAIPADVRNPDECRRLIVDVERHFGRLDVMVCNVGSGASVPPGQETASEWRRVLELNLATVTNMVEVATDLLARSRGAIACVSSICGIEALGAPVTYSVAKAALNAYVRGIARPLGERGIRINAIAPGNLLFEGSVWERRLAEAPEAVRSMLEREVALKRLGEPGEIADWVAFLASPRTAFATGAVFVVDGGQLRS